MALSDTCFGTLTELGSEFRNYCSWDYSAEYFSGVIDAMFSLTTVGVELDGLYHLSGMKKELVVARAVLLALLPDADEMEVSLRESILTSLSDVACINKCFAEALIEIESWLATAEGQYSLQNDYPQFELVTAILKTASLSTAGLAA